MSTQRTQQPAAEWLEQIAEYWREEHPDRAFSRVRALLSLGRLTFQMPAFQKRVLEPFQLSPSDYSILGALRRAGGTRTLVPGDLYSALHCTPGGLTKMIARLERQGLVQRLTDSKDGRRARIRLTPRGAEVERKAGAEYLDSADRLLSGLSSDELDQVNAALALLLECFEREDS
jgi:DNA-binding MarR family transcriptional regulator